MNNQEIPVFPKDLMTHLGIKGDALKQLIKTQKIPPFDVFLTQKTRFWHRSTLVKAGLMRDSQQQVATN